jgi:ribosomal protein S18 acetylase RimI-like enzyme
MKIGLMLVKTLIDEAYKIPGMQHIVLGVREGNLPAIRVYEQAGFITYQPDEKVNMLETSGYRRMIISRDNPVNSTG